jgi:hypothetical protein
MTSKREIPDWQLERYLLGELSAELEKEVRNQLARDPSLQTRLDALEESNREILSSYPPGIQVKQIEKKYEAVYGRQKKGRRRVQRPKLRSFAYALSTAAIILIVLIPLRSILKKSPSDGEMEGIRLKGLKPYLVVYRKSGDEIERLEAGEVAALGDVIQLSYVAAGKKFGAIYSIDGRGVVTLHYPDGEYRAAPKLQQGGEISLPYAYELDDAPLYERFFFITSDEPFDLAEAEDAVHTLALKSKRAEKKKLKLPSGFKQYSTILQKEEY